MKRVATMLVLITLGALAREVTGQTNSAAKKAVAASNTKPVKTELTEKDAIDLTSQYEAALSKKRDGSFPLYTDKDGAKVLLFVKGGKRDVSVVDKEGKPLSASRKIVSGREGEAWLCWGPNHTKPCVRILIRRE